MKVLVVGSSGFLGGWVKKLLLEDNKHEIIEIHGKKDLDITDIEILNNFFLKHKPQAVIIVQLSLEEFLMDINFQQECFMKIQK